MSGIGRNRVFDKAALEELKSQAQQLMDKAAAVTDELAEEMGALLEAAAAVPPEAAHPELVSAAEALQKELAPQPYADMKNKLEEVLDKLTSLIPAYDSQGASVLTALSDTAKSLAAMLEDLKGLVGMGSLTMSLEEFTGKLEEYGKRWKAQSLGLTGKMALAMTYLKGLVLTSCYSRDPVNLSTGNFYYEKEDLSIRGLIPLAFRRYYNALDGGSGDMGRGWSHTHGEYLEKKEGELVLHRADGKETAFRKKEGEYCDIHTGRYRLMETEEGWAFSGESRETLFFDREGRLSGRKDREGNAIAYTRDREGRLARAELATGEALVFAYREDGSLKEVTDHTGRKTAYFYMEGQLHEATDPEGNTISYRYGEDGRIKAVKNARGILTVKNEYDGNGRIIRQRFPDRGEMTYAYNDRENTTTLTERNGSTITYVQDERLRNIRTIYHDSEERETYNEKDLRTSHMDRNGNTTRYEYDGKGNLVRIINALGEERSFAFDKVLRNILFEAIICRIKQIKSRRSRTSSCSA